MSDRAVIVAPPDQEQLLALAEICTPQERRFAELWSVYRSKAETYRMAFGHTDRPMHRHDYTRAYEVFGRPHVTVYIRALEKAATANTVIDLTELIKSDLRIVQAAEHADRMSKITYVCCRHCYGVDHKYQWRDVMEYVEALQRIDEENAERAKIKQRPLPMPTDEGGFGYDPGVEPILTCPKCEGTGEMRTVFTATDKLGPAAPLFLGIKETKNGLEIQRHDVDKAKERLARYAGAFGDDAASVARGAAAGVTAALAAATGAAAKRTVDEPLTAESAERLYQEIAG